MKTKVSLLLVTTIALGLMTVPSSAQTQQQTRLRQRQQAVRQELGNRTTTTTNNNTSSSQSNDASRVKAINEGFDQRISSDNATALTIQMPGEESMPAYIKTASGALVLTKTNHKVNDQSSDIFAANLENIYPGALVFANADLANGDPTLVGLAPGTVTVRVDFNTGGSSKRENVPNKADKIQDAINSILNAANYTPAVNSTYKSFYTSSVQEMAADLKVSVNFLKASANVNTSVSSSSSTITEVQDYTQKYYTVSITQESDKSKYFGNSVTWSDISRKISNYRNAPIAIITSVTYGRRAYKFSDYSSNSFKLNASESASGYGQTLSSTQDIARKSEAKKVWMYLSGGDVDSAAKILTGTDINTAISSNLRYNRATNQGIPLYYTVRFLASGRTATVKTTGSYTTLEYREVPNKVTVTFRNNCTHVAGAGLKMRLDYKVFYFNSNGQRVYRAAQKDVESGYTNYNERNMGFGKQNTFVLDIGPGEYLEGPIRFQCRCKETSSGKWHNDIVCYVAPTDGVIDLDIHGAIRPGGQAAYIYSKSYTKALR